MLWRPRRLLLSAWGCLVALSCGGDKPTGDGSPVLGVSPLQVQVAGGRRETLLALRNEGGGALAWTVDEHQEWLVGTSPQGDTGDDGEFDGTGIATLTAITDSRGLARGRYDGAIDIRSDGGSVVVPVQLYVASTTPGQTRTFALPNGTTMDFVWVEPGRFLMGASRTSWGR